MAKFTVTKDSDFGKCIEIVEITTIEELLELRKKYNNSPIIIEDSFGENFITIHDNSF